jgi:hypothetical protein
MQCKIGCRTAIKAEVPLTLLSELEYPHWLMVAGAALVVFGFIGFAFRKNRNVEPEVKAKGK